MSTPSKIGNWLSSSATVKFILIGILALILLVPATMISSLIYERESRQRQVQNEVSQLWGKAQIIEGPAISVPYSFWVSKKDAAPVQHSGILHFLPEKLDIQGSIEPEIRYRSLYKAIVYNSKIQFTGSFNLDSTKANLPADATIHWDKGQISLSLSDSRGIQQAVEFQIGNETIKTEPGLDMYGNTGQSGVHSSIDLSNKKSFSFASDLDLNGSSTLLLSPIGKETTVHLSANWDKPKFMGAFLPDERQVDQLPVTADWKVLDFNRSYPQVWQDKKYNTYDSTFGVELLPAVGHYDKTRRSTEYALLIIALTFASFFLYEVLQGKRVHPIQYSLVGFALVIFYLLLVSFTEYMKFSVAYLIAAGIITLMSSSYFGSITRKFSSAIGMFGLMGVLYGFLYVVLSSDDYALLIGSIGLVIALGAIMFATRKVNWYQIRNSDSQE